MIPADTAEALVRAVEGAFPPSTPAKSTALVRSGRWFDENGKAHEYDDPESARIEAFLAGRPWNVLSADELLGWRHAEPCLHRLSPDGLAIYLPAFLVAFARAEVDPGRFAVLETLVAVLTPSPATPAPGGTRPPAQLSALERSRAQFFADFVALLDAPQRRTIASFLTALLPAFEEEGLLNPVRVALDGYWGQFSA